MTRDLSDRKRTEDALLERERRKDEFLIRLPLVVVAASPGPDSTASS